jgi:hypothetical protein
MYALLALVFVFLQMFVLRMNNARIVRIFRVRFIE